MSKQTRQQKREEEARILAEMDEALKAQGLAPISEPREKEEKYKREYDDTMPQKIHCRRCKTLMENGKCPVCGHTVYVPMNKQKQRKIKWIATGVLLVVFAALFGILQLLK
jgi:uncharacterized paraquat-inducible protein A